MQVIQCIEQLLNNENNEIHLSASTQERRREERIERRYKTEVRFKSHERKDSEEATLNNQHKQKEQTRRGWLEVCTEARQKAVDQQEA